MTRGSDSCLRSRAQKRFACDVTGNHESIQATGRSQAMLSELMLAERSTEYFRE